MTNFCGSWGFITWFSGGSAAWVVVNTAWLVFGREFDPYPFIALNLVLTVVSTFQSPLIMMSQNRQVERDRAMELRLHRKVDDLLVVVRDACSDCGGPQEGSEEWDKDCICGGWGTRTAQVEGLKAAIRFQQEKP